MQGMLDPPAPGPDVLRHWLDLAVGKGREERALLPLLPGRRCTTTTMTSSKTRSAHCNHRSIHGSGKSGGRRAGAASRMPENASRRPHDTPRRPGRETPCRHFPRGPAPAGTHSGDGKDGRVGGGCPGGGSTRSPRAACGCDAGECVATSVEVLHARLDDGSRHMESGSALPDARCAAGRRSHVDAGTARRSPTGEREG